MRKKLFGGQEPLGGKIRLQKLSCEVIGLLEAKGQSSMGMDQDDLVVIPLRTLIKGVFPEIRTSLSSGFRSGKGCRRTRSREDIERLMRERRHIAANKDDDFNGHGHERDRQYADRNHAGAHGPAGAGLSLSDPV